VNVQLVFIQLVESFVNKIEHSSSISDGQESWDLVSKDGMDIAYGVYVYHIDAPGVGQKLESLR